MPLQTCLQCKKDLIKATVVGESAYPNPAEGNTGFSITDIPSVMEKLGGVQGPLFMRKWFNGDAYELLMGLKTGKVDARTLDKAHVKEDLPFEWLEKSPRAGSIVQSTVDALSLVEEFSELGGKIKNPLDQLSRGLIVLMLRLEAMGLPDKKRKVLVDGSRFFGDLPAIELDYTAQFNRVDVEHLSSSRGKRWRRHGLLHRQACSRLHHGASEHRRH